MYVPLASLIQTRWWLGLWALLGVRNEFQQELGWREVTEEEFRVLQNGSELRSSARDEEVSC